MTYNSNKAKRKHFQILLLAIIAIWMVIPVFGQLKISRIERAQPTKVQKRTSSTARTSAIVSLPIFDDFSTTPAYNVQIPGSGYPDPDLWDSSDGVWIDEGPGINAPSVNVATFDGVDANGKIYNTSSQSNGFRDVLMTHEIDLSTNTIILSERPGVYLSFFYQWQGNGEPPDNNDFLQLELFGKDSVWTPVATKFGSDEIDKTVFTYVTVQLLDDKYFHDKFRFRFRNYGNQSGPFDTWNLDYVYLDKGRTADDAGFPDRAVASGMSQILGRYRSVPLSHYRLAPVYTPATVDIQNLRGGTEGSPTDIYLTQSFLNYIDGNLTRIEKPFGPIGSKYPNNFLLPGERVTSLLRTDVDPIDLSDPAFDFNSYFLPDADSIDLKIGLDLYEPDLGLFRSNDTLSATYHLNDYYAYDDGTGEYYVEVTQSDDQVVLGFDLIGEESQQLVGFDIYVPKYGINGYTTATFFVMNSENGAPNEKITTISHIVQEKNRDGFQTVSFDPILVNGRFFIGWKGSANGQLRVGLDYSNNASDMVYEDLNGVMENGKIKWFPAQSLSEGAIMIRPNFGAPSSNTGVITNKEKINFYPNPSTGAIYIDGVVTSVTVYTTTGQQIPCTVQNDGTRTLVSLNEAQNGVYILRVQKGADLYTEKVVIQR